MTTTETTTTTTTTASETTTTTTATSDSTTTTTTSETTTAKTTPSTSKTSAQKGDTVTVEITFYGYHPSAAGAVYLAYDPLLTPTAIRWNEDLEGYHVQSETEGYPAYFSWTTKSGKNQMIPNGTVLAYVDFEVSEFITSNSVLKITPQSSMLSDENGNEIKLNAGAGFIAVVSD